MIIQSIKCLFIICLIVSFFACVHSRVSGIDPYKIPVKSSENMDIRKFQQQTSISAAKGELWVKDALQVALKFVGSFEGRLQQITRKNDTAESASKVEIIITEEGYLDDSVRGSRYRLIIREDVQGIWQLIVAEKAWLCWPGRGQDYYSNQPCL